MPGLAAALYGSTAYALFVVTFLYAIGFVANLPLPRTIDSGETIERATYVLIASVVLLLLFWQWRSIPLPVWQVSPGVLAVALQICGGFGWALVLLSTFAISHFELFGLQQVQARLRDKKLPEPEFKVPAMYKVVRHPLYLGFILAFWGTPVMTVGHLLFALATTGYILIGIQPEERDLVAQFGERHRLYRSQVPMLLPIPVRRGARTALNFNQGDE